MSAQKADIPFSVARRKVMQTKILVADDQPGLRFLLSEALSGQGYEVITIESREHIFEVLEKEQPALILMDRHMPGEESFACRPSHGKVAPQDDSTKWRCETGRETNP